MDQGAHKPACTNEVIKRLWALIKAQMLLRMCQFTDPATTVHWQMSMQELWPRQSRWKCFPSWLTQWNTQSLTMFIKSSAYSSN